MKARVFRYIFLSALLIGIFSGCSYVEDTVSTLSSITRDRSEKIPPPPLEPFDAPRLFQSLPPAKLGESDVLSIFSLETTSPGFFITVDSSCRGFLWSSKESAPRQIFELPKEDRQYAFNGDKGVLAVSGVDTVEIRVAPTFEVRYTLKRVKAKVQSLAFAPDGKSLLIGAADSKVYRWLYIKEAETDSIEERDKAFERYNGPSAVIGSVRYHPFGRIFFSADWRGGLNAWLPYDTDIFKGDFDKNLFGPRFFSEGVNRAKVDRGVDYNAIDLMALDQAGKYVVLLNQIGLMEVWQVRGFSKVAFIQAHTGFPFALAISPSGEFIASAARDGKLTVWQIERKISDIALPATYQIVRVRDYDLPLTRAVSFLDDKTLIVGELGGRVLSIDISVLALEPIPTPTPVQ